MAGQQPFKADGLQNLSLAKKKLKKLGEIMALHKIHERNVFPVLTLACCHEHFTISSEGSTKCFTWVIQGVHFVVW